MTRDSRVKEFVLFFCAEYLRTFGRAYVVTGGKEGQLVKNLLKRLDGNGVDPLKELQRATRNMFTDTWARDKADIGLLAGKINSWLKGTADEHIDYGNGF